MIRVLIVEDNVWMRVGLAAILRNASGMLVAGEAQSGEEALQRFAETQPSIVIVDLHLPGIDGVETIKRIRSCSPGARVLAITALSGDDKICQALEAGAASYLLKGMTHTALTHALRRIDAGERFLPTVCARSLDDEVR